MMLPKVVFQQRQRLIDGNEKFESTASLKLGGWSRGMERADKGRSETE